MARRPGEKPRLIQVCAEVASPEPVVRGVRASRAAAGEYPGASLHAIALTGDVVPWLPEGVQVHAAALWLLGDMSGREDS